MVVRKGDKIYIGDFILTLAAPGGTFEGVSAREFRPRRSTSDAVPDTQAATDPPKPVTPTKEDIRVPSDIPADGSPLPAAPVAAATAAPLPSLPPPQSRPSAPPSTSGSTTAVSATAAGQSSPALPMLPPAK